MYVDRKVNEAYNKFRLLNHDFRSKFALLGRRSIHGEMAKHSGTNQVWIVINWLILELGRIGDRECKIYQTVSY